MNKNLIEISFKNEEKLNLVMIDLKKLNNSIFNMKLKEEKEMYKSSFIYEEIKRLKNNYFKYRECKNNTKKFLKYPEIKNIFTNQKNQENFKSQKGCFQDRNVFSLIGQTGGIFLEFGAADGTLNSNTYFFEKELGWKGICIEPNPLEFEQLKIGRNCTALNYGVGKEEKELTFIYAETKQLSGFKEFMSKNHLSRINYSNLDLKEEKIKSFPLEELIRKTEFKDCIIDFFSLDCEGCEENVLENSDLSRYKIISVETNPYNKDQNERIDKLLSESNYKLMDYGVEGCSFDKIYINRNYLKF